MVGAYAASVSALVAVITVMVAQTEVSAGQVEQGLAGTRTLRSTAANPASVSSAAPGCWPATPATADLAKRFTSRRSAP